MICILPIPTEYENENKREVKRLKSKLKELGKENLRILSKSLQKDANITVLDRQCEMLASQVAEVQNSTSTSC